jgi:adenine deaminase
VLTLTNVRLFDGNKGEPIEKVSIISIIIDGNRIKGIEPVSNYPDKTNVVDLRGLTVMPGLIDCHLHLGGLTVDKPGKAIGKFSVTEMVSFFWDYLRNYAHRRKKFSSIGIDNISNML